LKHHNLNKIISAIDGFIFPSKFTKNYHIKNLPISSLKSHVLPHFSVQIAKSPAKIPFKHYFVFVGRLSEEKGILPLLKIFANIPSCKLVVIGDGPLKNEVKKYKSFKNIKILGELPKPKVYSYMKNALYTIIPSPWYEVGPLVLFESFMNQTPVIAPDFGVFTERIQNLKTGYLYGCNNWDELKNIIIENNNKKVQSQIMGVNCYREYIKYHTPAIYYKKLMKIYSHLII